MGPQGPPGPYGPAGGVLTGSYPDPGLAAGSVTPAALAPQPGARVYATEPQSIANGDTEAVMLDQQAYRTGVTLQGDGSLLIQTPGVYLLSGEVLWSASAAGDLRLASITVDHVEQVADLARPVSSAAPSNAMATIARLRAGDVVRLLAGQVSGGALSTAPFAGRTAALAVQWLAP